MAQFNDNIQFNDLITQRSRYLNHSFKNEKEKGKFHSKKISTKKLY